MADFINTIDRLGDDAVMDSIIDRTITEFKDDQITSIGDYAFYGCSALTVVDCPNVKKLGFLSSNQSMAYIFFYCTALHEVNFPEVEIAGNKMFVGLTNLVSINMPKLRSISGDQFITSTGITRLNMSGLDGSVYRGSLYDNKKLEIVDLGGCTSIGTEALKGCSVLKAVILRRNVDVVTLGGTNAFTNTPVASGTGYIYVPSSLVDSYKSATNWSIYATQIRALEDYTVDGTITGELDETKI